MSVTNALKADAPSPSVRAIRKPQSENSAHPMGPLALCDMIGLDVLEAVCDSLYDEFKQPAYAPPAPLRRMTAAGNLGRKVNRGFYDYTRERETADRRLAASGGR